MLGTKSLKCGWEDEVLLCMRRNYRCGWWCSVAEELLLLAQPGDRIRECFWVGKDLKTRLELLGQVGSDSFQTECMSDSWATALLAALCCSFLYHKGFKNQDTGCSPTLTGLRFFFSF